MSMQMHKYQWGFQKNMNCTMQLFKTQHKTLPYQLFSIIIISIYSIWDGQYFSMYVEDLKPTSFGKGTLQKLMIPLC